MDKVRVAIVGCRSISQLSVPGYLTHPACQVVALCDPVRQRAERLSSQLGIAPRILESYDDVLNDSQVDAVELLTPTPLHPRQVVAALDAGKHVSCQKPLSATVAEADQVLAAASRSTVMENFFFYPPLVKAKELLDGGAIGEPSLVRIRTVVGTLDFSSKLTIMPEAFEWRRDAGTAPGGLLYDDAWHKYATAMWWIGDVEKVWSAVTRTDDFFIEAPAVITWKFKDRECLGVFEYSYAPQMDFRSSYYPVDVFFEIHGSKGIIWVTRCTGEMLDPPPVVVHTGGQSTSYQVPMDWIEGFNGSAHNFIDCIIRGEQPEADIPFARKVLLAALATYRAADSETAVDPSTIPD